MLDHWLICTFVKFRWTILEFLVGEEVREISECLQ